MIGTRDSVRIVRDLQAVAVGQAQVEQDDVG